MRLVLGLAAAIAGVSAGPALACSCRCQSNAAALLREIPILFRGSPEGGRASGTIRRYAFTVRVAYKGDVSKRLVLTTPAESAACGVRFELGQEVLVGAFPESGEARTNNCTQFCLGQRREEVDRLLARCTPGGKCPPDA